MEAQLTIFDQPAPAPLPAPAFNHPACVDPRLFFETMTPERRQIWKARYEELLSIENGTYCPKTNMLGKQMNYPARMPWMVPAWTRGLELVNQVIQQKKTSHQSKPVKA